MKKKITNDIRIYPIYCLFGWDLLFYYSIATLFLLNVKHIDPSQLVLIDGIAALGFCIFQIPIRIIASKFSNKINILIGLISWIFGMTIILLAPDYKFIIAGRLFFSLGSCFKGASEVAILHEPLIKLKKLKWFNIVFGKGLSSYMYINALGAMIAGVLFNINSYIPMTVSIICIAVAFVTALKFNNNQKEEKITTKESMYQLKKGIQHIKNSSRLKVLFLYTAMYFALFGVTSSYTGIYLKETGINPMLYSIIFAVFHITQAICSDLEYKIEKKLKRKTLTAFSLTHVISFIFVGVIGIFTKNIMFVTILFIIQHGIMVMDRVARNRYLTNFTSNEVRGSILSINYIIENFSRFIGLLAASFLLKKFDISVAYIILGLLFLALVIKVIDVMRDKIGLNPEQYNTNEKMYDTLK